MVSMMGLAIAFGLRKLIARGSGGVLNFLA